MLTDSLVLFVFSIGPSCFNNTVHWVFTWAHAQHATALRLCVCLCKRATRCNHAAEPPAAVPDVTMKFAKELERDLVPGESDWPGSFWVDQCRRALCHN